MTYLLTTILHGKVGLFAGDSLLSIAAYKTFFAILLHAAPQY